MTSIEWLIDQMFRQGYFDGNKPLSFTNLDHLQQQAKEMHKAEIVNTYIIADSESTIEDAEHNAEKYYERQFKKD